jgi:cytoskeletal protein CcmA (bactofilin family)
MWSKPNEAKPSSQASEVPSPEVSAPVPEPAAPLPAIPAVRVLSKISSGLKINGELSGDSDLYIDGEVHGKIHLANARVTVGPSGKVQAELEAREIIIDGTVQGNLKASDSVHLGPSSRVVGGVITPRIGIEDGARLRGKVETVPANRSRESAAVHQTESKNLPPVTAGAKVGS